MSSREVRNLIRENDTQYIRHLERIGIDLAKWVSNKYLDYKATPVDLQRQFLDRSISEFYNIIERYRWFDDEAVIVAETLLRGIRELYLMQDPERFNVDFINYPPIQFSEQYVRRNNFKNVHFYRHLFIAKDFSYYFNPFIPYDSSFIRLYIAEVGDNMRNDPILKELTYSPKEFTYTIVEILDGLRATGSYTDDISALIRNLYYISNDKGLTKSLRNHIVYALYKSLVDFGEKTKVFETPTPLLLVQLRYKDFRVILN